jgi:predicted nucleic acid-binding protein
MQFRIDTLIYPRILLILILNILVFPSINIEMKKLRIYIDTSVIGGCCDEEFAEESKSLIEQVKQNIYTLLVSEVVIEELESAPENVQNILKSIPKSCIERIELTKEMLTLQEAYLQARILDERWATDALHVATATVARADAIVSWNFRHIVKLEKIRAYNQLNLQNGYGIITIISPREVIGDDEEDD